MCSMRVCACLRGVGRLVGSPVSYTHARTCRMRVPPQISSSAAVGALVNLSENNKAMVTMLNKKVVGRLMDGIKVWARGSGCGKPVCCECDVLCRKTGSYRAEVSRPGTAVLFPPRSGFRMLAQAFERDAAEQLVPVTRGLCSGEYRSPHVLTCRHQPTCPPARQSNGACKLWSWRAAPPGSVRCLNSKHALSPAEARLRLRTTGR